MDLSKKKREKLSLLMIEKNLVSSLKEAEAIILAGKVVVNGIKVEKGGALIEKDASIKVIDGIPFVSRGGIKLKNAFMDFDLDIRRKKAIDVGSSTGGFTDFLLQSGAEKVIAIDVGYGLLSWKLRTSPEVIVMERTNVRNIGPQMVPFLSDITVVDVSFISIKTIFKNIYDITSDNGVMLILVKPQFEAPKSDVEKGGIIRKKEIHQKIMHDLIKEISSYPIEIKGITFSKLKGAKGNMEFWLYIKKTGKKNNISGLNNEKTMVNYDRIITDIIKKGNEYFK